MTDIDLNRKKAYRKSVAHVDKKCPRCYGYMLIREGKFGWFWGCSEFPACTVTMHVLDIGICPECGKNLTIEGNKGFCKCGYKTQRRDPTYRDDTLRYIRKNIAYYGDDNDAMDLDQFLDISPWDDSWRK